MMAGVLLLAEFEVRAASVSRESPAFFALTNFSSFQRSTNSAGEVELISGWIISPFAWDELVVSWNALTPSGSGMKFEARADGASGPTKFYVLGVWASDITSRRRESVNGQKDDHGDVSTDTLILRRPSERLQLRVTSMPNAAGRWPELKFIGLSLVQRGAAVRTIPPDKSAWGRILPVPERSQLSYANGREWCSATSVSMVLSYWAKRLSRPELDIDVSAVAAGVNDPTWQGTGNWSFNTAFAGEQRGMRASVVRFADIAELEALIVAGVPVVISISYQLLYDRPSSASNGHLVVCIGFTEKGDAVINDPWADFKKGDKVRAVIPRANLAKGWAHSKRTAYVIHPETWPMPGGDALRR